MKSKKSIKITVPNVIFQRELDEAMEIINKARNSINAIKEENFNFERIHDQYIIHLQQCQGDHGQLREIFKTLKQKLDYSSHNYPSTTQIKYLVTSPRRDRLAPPSLASLENYNGTPEIQTLTESPTNIKLRYALNTSSHLGVIQFSSDGSKIAFADGYFLYIINAENGEIFSIIQLPLPLDGEPHSLALKFSPNDDLLAINCCNGSIILFDLEKEAILHRFELHKNEVNSIIFVENKLISCSYDGFIAIWDTKTYKVIKVIPENGGKFESPIIGMAAADGAPFYIVGFANGRIGIFDEDFMQPMISFIGHENEVFSVALSAYDNCIGTSSSFEQIVKIWSLRGVASLRQTLIGHTGFVKTIAFSSLQQLVFTGSSDKSICMWQYITGVKVAEIRMHDDEISCLSHHPRKKSFASCSKDGIICVWDYDFPN
ncbi:Transcriptional repressor tup12-related protein [Histomonas meleagridis]|uniref:Transcriptional repressor tup12-related protein n=1 Tax=Histomonas meleagridis TaxID=135588 RepID=UPI00355A871A|nr:Transcriptional repressor tup12-related protein [Histomonas meleagridis]KAH0806282.1 Transcriptional repressor tup12-related protein [Histomonas meleagridis]